MKWKFNYIKIYIHSYNNNSNHDNNNTDSIALEADVMLFNRNFMGIHIEHNILNRWYNYCDMDVGLVMVLYGYRAMGLMPEAEINIE